MATKLGISYEEKTFKATDRKIQETSSPQAEMLKTYKMITLLCEIKSNPCVQNLKYILTICLYTVFPSILHFIC